MALSNFLKELNWKSTEHWLSLHMKLKRNKTEDEDPKWVGWTRDPKLVPVEEIEKDGYILELREDFKGKYYQIVKAK